MVICFIRIPVITHNIFISLRTIISEAYITVRVFWKEDHRRDFNPTPTATSANSDHFLVPFPPPPDILVVFISIIIIILVFFLSAKIKNYYYYLFGFVRPIVSPPILQLFVSTVEIFHFGPRPFYERLAVSSTVLSRKSFPQWVFLYLMIPIIFFFSDGYMCSFLFFLRIHYPSVLSF